jgi:hypothetical protein
VGQDDGAEAGEEHPKHACVASTPKEYVTQGMDWRPMK